MELSDDFLLRLARQAGIDYFKIYGDYPTEIGIEEQRFKGMIQDTLIFPSSPLSQRLALASIHPGEIPSLKLNVCRLVPVLGVDEEDVHICLPILRTFLSGAGLARMAKPETDIRKCK